MKFVDAYKAKYGLEPEGYGTSSSYMAVYTIKDAIERAGTLDPDKVVEALKATDLMGVYGRIRFDPQSNQVIPSTDPKEGAVGTIFQWQDWQTSGGVSAIDRDGQDPFASVDEEISGIPREGFRGPMTMVAALGGRLTYLH